MTTPRPQWRGEFLHDFPAFEQYAREMRAWQLVAVLGRRLSQTAT
jgi:hypothetical protein